MRKVPALQGMQWIATALRLFGRHFTVFFMLGLLLVLISQIPYLGTIVILLLGPALLAGIVHAAAQAAQGTRPGPGMLFKGFDGSHHLPSLVALCLPSIGWFLLIAIAFSGVMLSAVGHDPAKLQALQSDPTAMLALLRTHALPLLVIVLAGALLNTALTFFAVPQVILRQQGGFAAMGQSLRAVWRNLGALALMLLGLIALALAISVLLTALVAAGAALGGWWRLALMVLFMAISYSYSAVLMYVAWRDVFADAVPAPPSATGMVHAEM
ncbi:BPSS1780 family membrane protein [Metallibacterium sp.]|uniref:BPSS1780 family membrane protein n=1 Tax=Metallibacterium sp. TaxID=2940281 RepID=UPI002629209B|nr:BPSS1780 family membrane protein [Metallibacterium sp.]